MRISKVLSFLLAVLFLAGTSLSAQTDLISAKELKDLMKNNEDLVIVDGNKSSNYAASHIKGAINIYHMDLYQDGDLSGIIMSPEDLAAFFGDKGISETTPVVVYDDGSQKYSSRVYWILKYIGAEEVKILHKDMDEWAKVRLPLASAATILDPVTFTPDVNPEVFATLDYVKENKDRADVVLVDVRTAEEFNGEKSNSDGHIPGAININYEDLLTDTGAFKPVEALKAIAEANGITPEKEVIFYCRTSVRGTVSFIAFRNILGYDQVRVYDGAYLEWAAANPVVQ